MPVSFFVNRLQIARVFLSPENRGIMGKLDFMLLNYLAYAVCQVMVLVILPDILQFGELLNDVIVCLVFLLLFVLFFVQHSKIRQTFGAEDI